MSQQVPGFQFLFQTNRSDMVLIYLPTEGFLGALGQKREVFVTKANLAEVCTELMLGVPVWFVQSGIPQKIESELNQWTFYGKPMDMSL